MGSDGKARKIDEASKKGKRRDTKRRVRRQWGSEGIRGAWGGD